MWGVCLQDALVATEAQVREGQAAVAEQAEQLALRAAAATRLEDELTSLRAAADAQREAERRTGRAADEAREEHAARLRDAEEAAATRGRELAVAHDDVAALSEDNAMLRGKVCSCAMPNARCRAGLSGFAEVKGLSALDLPNESLSSVVGSVCLISMCGSIAPFHWVRGPNTATKSMISGHCGAAHRDRMHSVAIQNTPMSRRTWRLFTPQGSSQYPTAGTSASCEEDYQKSP